MQYDILQAGVAQLSALHMILPALLLLLVEESGVILMIPGDVILAYMGYQVANTSGASLALAMVATTVVVCLGASILFWISRRWGHHAIKRLSTYLFISDRRLAQAESMFKKYGFWAVLVGRHIPGLRVPITIFAGTSGMSYGQFLLSTLLSVVPWIIFFMQVGHFVGHRIHVHLHYAVVQTVVVLVCVVALVIALHVYRARTVKRSQK